MDTDLIYVDIYVDMRIKKQGLNCLKSLILLDRSDKIRTCDLCLPKAAL